MLRCSNDFFLDLWPHFVYTIPMYEWDEDKREVNLAKHKLDFVESIILFDGRPVIEIAARTEEPRVLTVGQIGEKFYTVVWTQRGAARRIISFRRARDEEERAYKNLHG